MNSVEPSRIKAMARGAIGRCPKCGQGRLFRAYLKVADACPNCGEELHHHRADDFPPYAVITILGHIFLPLVLAIELAYSPPYWLQLVVWLPTAVLLAMALLQPVKGAIVALQWSIGMHGFEASKSARAKALTAA